MDFSGQTPSLEMSVRVLPSGTVQSQGCGVDPWPRWCLGCCPCPIPGSVAGMGHFQDIASPAVGAQLALAARGSLGGIWSFVGGNVAGEISTCHEQIHLIREQGLTFFAFVGG